MAVAGTDNAACAETARGFALLQFGGRAKLDSFSKASVHEASCNESSWPDLDHGRTCGACKVLVNRFRSYKTCNGYCRSIDRKCVGAWEERQDTCEVKHDMSCGQSIDSSDAICECSLEKHCYKKFETLAVEEGFGVGSPIHTRSALACQEACDGNANCNSFTLCSNWYRCWMKDRSFVGNETTKVLSDCKTYYKSSNCTRASGGTIKVMSYNTEFRGYNRKLRDYANKIREIKPVLVGLQECQNRDGLANLAGLSANKLSGGSNYMLFDSRKVHLVSGGRMRIPRDNYARRYITWGVFMLGDAEFFFFNTHLPHNHNEARSKSTHARIARMFLQKRRELGAENKPTIVVGDMNSHASSFNRHPGGGFESNLRDNGFVLAYTARGNPGFPRIDHILYSEEHWTHSNCKDTGTGGSDHTSITCDLKLTPA